jgi:hypothetical protein
VLTGQLVERCIQLAGFERLAGFDLLTTLPPVGRAGIKDLLPTRFCRALFGLRLLY